MSGRCMNGLMTFKSVDTLSCKIPNSCAIDILAGYHVCFIAGGLCFVTFPGAW